MAILSEPLRHMQSIGSNNASDFKYISSAKTNLNSLLMHNSLDKQTLVLTQYIPLPAYKTTVKPDNSMTDMLESFRTPLFFLMFIGVLIAQIYWRKNKADKEWEEKKAKMGPLERQLMTSKSGQKLTANQVKEVQELDQMLGGMGSMVDNMKLGDLGANFE